MLLFGCPTHAPCLEDTDGEMEFAYIEAGIEGGFENTMEFKPMKYKETINGPDGEAWVKGTRPNSQK
jgi:hypothetical protein